MLLERFPEIWEARGEPVADYSRGMCNGWHSAGRCSTSQVVLDEPFTALDEQGVPSCSTASSRRSPVRRRSSSSTGPDRMEPLVTSRLELALR